MSNSSPEPIFAPCTQYTWEQLADIYSQARVDYIVPMPMNGKRMMEYVQHYDVNLTLSLVALDADDYSPMGVCMLGVRAQRGWVTRLGIIPRKRRNSAGRHLMQTVIQRAQEQGITQLQLEVIVGNTPALTLFEKMGFSITRDLLIVRRPPARPANPPEEPVAEVTLTEDWETIAEALAMRHDQPTWLEETVSLRNAGGMRLLTVRLTDGAEGWLAFQRTPFQLTHFVFAPDMPTHLYSALIAQLHAAFPVQDTKVENVPLDHPAWASGAFQQHGYLEVFRRHEMVSKSGQATENEGR